jgi:ABC-type nitrate/sulfonate/bicarbonate transport system substrate-binding protein
MPSKKDQFRVIALTSVVLVLIALTALLVDFLVRDDAPRPHVRELAIALAVEDNVFPTLVYVAHDQGYFEDEGVHVSLRSFPSAKLALRTVLDGESHIATTTGVPIARGTLRGESLAIASTVGFTDRAFRVVARKDRNITLPSDLVGKSVAARRASPEHFFLEVFLDHHGIDPSDVRLVFMSGSEMPDALIEGRVDAFAMRQPFIGEALAGLDDRGVVFDAPDRYRSYLALVTTPEFVDLDEGELDALLRALVRAEQLVRSDPDEAIDAVVRQLGETRRLEVECAWSDYRFEVSAGQGFLLNLESEARWLIRTFPELEGPVPDYLEMFDTQPLLRVRPASVTVWK